MAYKSKYVRTSIVRDLFQEGEQKIRISADAKPMVYEYLDNKVQEGVKELIDKLPRKSKGANKGDFKRVTIQERDFEEEEEE